MYSAATVALGPNKTASSAAEQDKAPDILGEIGERSGKQRHAEDESVLFCVYNKSQEALGLTFLITASRSFMQVAKSLNFVC